MVKRFKIILRSSWGYWHANSLYVATGKKTYSSGMCFRKMTIMGSANFLCWPCRALYACTLYFYQFVQKFDFREVYFSNNAKSKDLACSTPLAVGAGYDCFDYHPIFSVCPR